jgi:hypothetical protein
LPLPEPGVSERRVEEDNAFDQMSFVVVSVASKSGTVLS